MKLNQLISEVLVENKKPNYDFSKQANINNIIERAKKEPKFHIWFGAYNLLIHITDMFGYSDYKNWLKAKSLFEDEDIE
jgi:hypothetical protein